MIVLFTDFGLEGPYVGQVKAVLHREAPGVPVVDLLADAPPFEPKLCAYLLAAYAEVFPPPAVFLAVVDPGVGSDRAPLAVCAGGRWFVGPDNGLFQIAARRVDDADWHEITWRPERMSASFHGRDLFAPVAARLARHEPVPGDPRPASKIGADWPDDLASVVYVDRFGNAVTGLRAAALPEAAVIEVSEQTLPRRTTFADAPEGEPFWYENSNGLVEIAINQARADVKIGLWPGTPVTVHG
ncbi:MAG: SAM-dependent chlorinase/fluorinase [Alphaproteobacteria bacterium]|nr:SAM-dependent chlorinase/fluorinase [Alphaproteobacteria bacterium]